MRARILVVDDEMEIRRSVRMILEYEGYDVLEASSGPEGIALVEKESPDLVFLDVKMPGMDGLEALQRPAQALGVIGDPLSRLGLRRDRRIGRHHDDRSRMGGDRRRLERRPDETTARPFRPEQTVGNQLTMGQHMHHAVVASEPRPTGDQRHQLGLALGGDHAGDHAVDGWKVRAMNYENDGHRHLPHAAAPVTERDRFGIP